MIDARLSDWETRFADYILSATEAARVGRTNFCGLFAAGAVEAVTGENVTVQFRGRLKDVAKRLEATIDGLFPVRPVAFARRADLVWSGGAVGVVIGADALFVGADAQGAPGLIRVPRSAWEKAWSVGGV